MSSLVFIVPSLDDRCYFKRLNLLFHSSEPLLQRLGLDVTKLHDDIEFRIWNERSVTLKRY